VAVWLMNGAHIQTSSLVGAGVSLVWQIQ